MKKLFLPLFILMLAVNSAYSSQITQSAEFARSHKQAICGLYSKLLDSEMDEVFGAIVKDGDDVAYVAAYNELAKLFGRLPIASVAEEDLAWRNQVAYDAGCTDWAKIEEYYHQLMAYLIQKYNDLLKKEEAHSQTGEL